MLEKDDMIGGGGGGGEEIHVYKDLITFVLLSLPVHLFIDRLNVRQSGAEPPAALGPPKN